MKDYVRRVELTVEESRLDQEESFLNGLNGSADGEATPEMEVNGLSEIKFLETLGFARHARIGRGGVVAGIAVLHEGHFRCGVLTVLWISLTFPLILLALWHFIISVTMYSANRILNLGCSQII
jgi:hypothetical protein